TDVLGLPAK
nr:RecName: Full=Unknown protein 1 [Cycas revoluta]